MRAKTRAFIVMFTIKAAAAQRRCGGWRKSIRRSTRGRSIYNKIKMSYTWTRYTYNDIYTPRIREECKSHRGKVVVRVNYQLLRIARVYVYRVAKHPYIPLQPLRVHTLYLGKISLDPIYMYIHVYVGFLHGNTVTQDYIAIISIFHRLPTPKLTPFRVKLNDVLVFYVYINVMSAFRVWWTKFDLLVQYTQLHQS